MIWFNNIQVVKLCSIRKYLNTFDILVYNIDILVFYALLIIINEESGCFKTTVCFPKLLHFFNILDLSVV